MPPPRFFHNRAQVGFPGFVKTTRVEFLVDLSGFSQFIIVFQHSCFCFVYKNADIFIQQYNPIKMRIR